MTGIHTDKSIEIILEQLGYDFEGLRALDDDMRNSFAKAVVPYVQSWFEPFGVKVEPALITEAIIHALEAGEDE